VKWKLVLVRLEIMLISAQDKCTVCVDVPYACKLLWAHPIELLGDVGQVELVSVCLEIVLFSGQDRCMVCAKRTIGEEIIFDIPNGTAM
jgi:hypothetical protein